MIKEYIKENLKLEIKEEHYGFNGSYLDIRLLLDGEVISSDTIDIKRDEG